MKILSSILFIVTLSTAHANLILIGGGKRPANAMKEFVALSGQENARILIIPWASESSESAEIIKSEIEVWNPQIIEIASHRLNTSMDISRFHKNFKKFTGVFFTGGDQNKLMNILKEYQLQELFRKRHKEGMIFAGTSAGTAIMSNPMLTGNHTELTEGLGLLPPNYIVDQHFVVRNRINRLSEIILGRENAIGIGVDEDTALVIIESKAKVIGPSQVILIEKSSQKQLKITVKHPGQEFFIKRSPGPGL